MRTACYRLSLSMMALAGCAKPPESPTVAQPSEVAQAEDQLPLPDRDFVREATGAHAAAMHMGRLAMERGSNDRVKAIGRDMVETHTRLNDRMRQIAKDGAQVILPMPQMTPRQKGDYQRLSQLSGPEFDQAFLDAVIKIQNETLLSFNQEALNGLVSGLREFANGALPLLNDRVRWVRAEIMRM